MARPRLNPWPMSIAGGLFVTAVIAWVADPMPLWAIPVVILMYVLTFRFAPLAFAAASGERVNLRHPVKVKRWDIAAVRRESHALGLPFPEADGSLSWPPELSEPVPEPKRRHSRKNAEWTERDEWLERWTEPVSAAAYEAWLQRWCSRGGKITHNYDRSLPDGKVRRLVAEPTHWPYKWCGSLSIELIIPARLSHVVGRIPRSFHDQWGHSTVYVFTKTGDVDVLGDWVPAYRNVRGHR